MKKYFDTGRNKTNYNYFISIPLADDLVANHQTIKEL